MYQAVDSRGYKKVTFSYRGTLYQIQSHRLVWIVFKGRILDKRLVVNHKDGNKENNRLRNLELVASKTNAKHAIDTGLTPIPKGEARPNAKFSDRRVAKLREKFAKGKVTATALALKYDVSKPTMTSMLCGKTYRHIETGFETSCSELLQLNLKSKPNLSQALVRKIKRMRSAGGSSYSISNETGLARNTVMKYW